MKIIAPAQIANGIRVLGRGRMRDRGLHVALPATAGSIKTQGGIVMSVGDLTAPKLVEDEARETRGRKAGLAPLAL